MIWFFYIVMQRKADKLENSFIFLSNPYKKLQKE